MSWYEILTCIELGLIYGIAALGIYLSFRIIDFPDLTCDGSFVLGASSAAMLLKAGASPIVALSCAILCGGLAGLCTGVLHIYFKISNLLSGILTAFMLYSVNLKVMQGVPNIALIDLPVIFGMHPPAMILTFIVIIMGCAIAYLLNSDLGLALQSIGQNKHLAKNCGISIWGMTILALILSNALIALSGALFAQHQGFADVTSGVGTIIIGLAAIMIGEKIWSKTTATHILLACILGSIIYRLLVAFALHNEWLGLETQDLNLITGIMIVAIMFLPKGKRACLN